MAGVVVAAMVAGARTGAQAPPDMQKLAASFEQAWAKGDAKGLAAQGGQLLLASSATQSTPAAPAKWPQQVQCP